MKRIHIRESQTGYLDKLFKLFSATYDKSNSITEGINLVTESKEILNEFLDSNYGKKTYSIIALGL